METRKYCDDLLRAISGRCNTLKNFCTKQDIRKAQEFERFCEDSELYGGCREDLLKAVNMLDQIIDIVEDVCIDMYDFLDEY